MHEVVRVELESTVHQRMERAVPAGTLAAETQLEVTLMLRENPDGPVIDDVVSQMAGLPLGKRSYYSHDQYVAAHGASLDDLRLVRRFAKDNGLSVVRSDRGCRTIRLRGTAEQLNEAFGVTLERQVVKDNGKLTSFHTHSGAVTVDERLAAITTNVFGLDTRPFAKPQFRIQAAQPRANNVSYNPNQVAKAYNYPTDGSGITIGLIELGGTVSAADVTTYFTSLGLAAPKVIHVAVDGQQPVSDPGGADVEVALDVDVAGAMAPGCTIVIYDAPNTDQGFVDAIMAAANDTVNKPMAVSISWGAPESQWTAASMLAMNQAFLSGNSQGLVYTAAAGDNGATDGVTDGLDHADHPASAPNAVGTGGTSLKLAADGSIASEVVWGGSGAQGATGGGVSDQFPVPSYQSNNGINPVSLNPKKNSGRGVPDVSGNADPATGYNILTNGQNMVVGGTSAAAPQWAAMFALGTKQLGKGMGPVHSLLYAAQKAKQAFRDIVSGNNGDGNNNGYPAKTGYDLASGLGSPDASVLIEAIGAAVPAPAPAPKCPPTKVHKGKGSVTIIVNEGGQAIVN